MYSCRRNSSNIGLSINLPINWKPLNIDPARSNKRIYLEIEYLPIHVVHYPGVGFPHLISISYYFEEQENHTYTHITLHKEENTWSKDIDR